MGAKKLLCVFWVIPYGGERHINKIPPKLGAIESIAHESCLSVFFAPKVQTEPYAKIVVINWFDGKCTRSFALHKDALDVPRHAVTPGMWET